MLILRVFCIECIIHPDFPTILNLADGGSMRRRARQMSRREVYSCLEELNSDKSHAVLSFANIFNRQSCWKKGVF